jgi:hypothetical protein
MASLAPSPSRLEVFPTLREGLSLLPRAIGSFLLLNLAALGLALLLMIFLGLPLSILRRVMEVGGLGASGRGAQVAAALPIVMDVVGWMIQAYVSLLLVVAQYRLAAEIRAGLRPRILEVFARSSPPLLPLVLLVFVLVLGITVGLGAFVVPGVILFLMSSQALPAMIFEGTNVRGSLLASFMLTQGVRLKLLGLALVLIPLAFVPALLSDFVRRLAGDHASLAVILPTIAIALILLFLVYCLASLVALIVYQDLRARGAPAQPQHGEGVPA